MRVRTKRGEGPVGIQTRIANESGIARTTINAIFQGKRRPTPEQARALEPLLFAEGYAITRFDMVFGWKKGMPLLSLDKTRAEVE